MAFYIPASFAEYPFLQAQGNRIHDGSFPHDCLTGHDFIPGQLYSMGTIPSGANFNRNTQMQSHGRKRHGEPMNWVEYIPLPHFAPEDVEAHVNNGKVRIVAKRTVGDDDNHVCHESRRCVDIPHDVDSSKVTCHYVRRQFVLVEGPRNETASSKEAATEASPTSRTVSIDIPVTRTSAARSPSALNQNATAKGKPAVVNVPVTFVPTTQPQASTTRETTPSAQPAHAAAASTHASPTEFHGVGPSTGGLQDASKKSAPTATVKPLNSGSAGKKPGEEGRQTDAAARKGREVKLVPDDGTGDVYPDFPRDSGLDFALKDNRETIARVAAELKQIGNSLYKEQKYDRAFAKYSKALRYIERLIHGPVLGREEVQELRIQYELPLLNNLAACNLKLENFPEVLEECDKVLAVDPGNVKALFRRGEAYFGLQRYEEAVSSLLQAQKLDPQDKAVLKELQRARKAAERPTVEEKEMFGKMFSK